MTSGSFTLGPGESTGPGLCHSSYIQPDWLGFAMCCLSEGHTNLHVGHHPHQDGVMVDWAEHQAYRLERVQAAEDALKRVERIARLSQVGGDHYSKHQIQPWDVVDEYDLGYYEGNVLKYLLRSKTNRLEDLQKARHYLDKAIERVQAEEDKKEK